MLVFGCKVKKSGDIMNMPNLDHHQAKFLRKVSELRDPKLLGYIHHAQELLAGNDPTGGLVDIELQVAEIERQILAIYGTYN
jgi:hypothetical protein